MTARKKPKLGRPAYADQSRVLSVVRTIKLTAAEDAAWRSAADTADVSVNEWIRDQVDRNVVATIVVSPDDGDWHWVAYDAKKRPISMGAIADGPKLEERVRSAALDHGLRVTADAAVAIER